MKTKLLASLGLMLVTAGIIFAQMTAREEQPLGIAMPEWKYDPEFSKDVFTWVRLKYSVSERHGYGHAYQNRWAIDFPDCDLNISYRVQQMSSIKVDPDGKALEMTDEELSHYPFLYMVEPGRLSLEPDEIRALRRYLLNGGFLMVDDFWGNREWDNFLEEMHGSYRTEGLFPLDRFPNQKIVDLPLDHPIFQGVFPLSKKPQVPGMELWERDHSLTYDPRRDGSEEPQYRAILDDRGRMMVLICHNTDLGDAWEQEAAHPEYFHTFSEKQAYPLGINIIFYAMTH